MTAALVYHELPAEVSHVSAYRWRSGVRPAPLPFTLAREGGSTTVTFAEATAVIVLLERRDGSYLLDGPVILRDITVDRASDLVWRRTTTGTTSAGSETMPPIEWLASDDGYGGAWPACWWKAAAAWECFGVPVGSAGVAVATDVSRVLSAVVNSDTAPVLRPSVWGRLLFVTDRVQGVPPRLRYTPARPSGSTQGAHSVRLDTVAMSDVRATSLAPGVVWVAGDSSPPDSWLEIRSARSGPEYLPLADLAGGPVLAPMRITLGDRRDVAALVTSGVGDAVAGAIVSVFRLIDPVPPVSVAGRPPPRRVLATERIAAADGTVRLDGLGDADYEIVAWHSQLGRSSIRLERTADHVVIRLLVPGVARGRVLMAGKPAAGVDVISVPDPAAYASADDPIDLKGGDTRTGADGRFAVAVARGGGGELRVGGGTSTIVRVTLPREPLPLVDLGDIELARGITLSVVLDQDPGCDLRATGPIGKTGLQIVNGSRTGPGLFSIVLPEEGAWEIGLMCGRQERAVAPAVVHVSSAGPRELTLAVR